VNLLERCLTDLAEHPDSSAKDIAKRLGANDRRVFAVLDHAAYSGKCQRWRKSASGGPWLWELPGCTACEGVS
jgi:hypothetical protein